MSKINIGIIGTGANTFNYINAIKQNENLNLSIISDGNINYACDLTKGLSCVVCNNDYGIIYNENIDAVIISTSYNKQIELTKMCLIAGKNVLVDKLIGDQREIIECYNLAEQNELVLFVGLFKRHNLDYMKMKDKLKNIKNIYSVNRTSLNKPYRTSNGLIGEMIYYDLDVILHYLDFKMPNKILAIGNCENKELKKVKELEDLDIKLIYNGLIINISASRNSTYGFDDRIEIINEEGLTKIINRPYNNIINTNKKGEIVSYVDNNKYIRYKSSYFYLLDYFEKVIINGYPNNIKKVEVLKLNKICNLIQKSIKEKKIVKVGGVVKSITKM